MIVAPCKVLCLFRSFPYLVTSPHYRLSRLHTNHRVHHSGRQHSYFCSVLSHTIEKTQGETSNRHRLMVPSVWRVWNEHSSNRAANNLACWEEMTCREPARIANNSWISSTMRCYQSTATDSVIHICLTFISIYFKKHSLFTTVFAYLWRGNDCNCNIRWIFDLCVLWQNTTRRCAKGSVSYLFVLCCAILWRLFLWMQYNVTFL